MVENGWSGERWVEHCVQRRFIETVLLTVGY